MDRVTETSEPCTPPEATAERIAYPTTDPSAQITAVSVTEGSRSSEPDTPTVTPIKVSTSRDGTRTVTIVCVYCGRRHAHGWPAGMTIGHRVSHCDRDVEHLGYRILTPADAS